MSMIYGIVRDGVNAGGPLTGSTLLLSMEAGLAAPLHWRRFSWSDHFTSLGVRVSAFLPEDDNGGTPRVTAGHPAILVADVRLDNRSDLLEALSLPDSAGLSDSDLLLQAWLRWGKESLTRVVGVFAFAVWDPSTQTLFAARDATGERPLFYHRGTDFFAFASMPRGLLALPGVDRGVNEDTVLASLTLAKYPQNQSFFAGISRLPPGHCLTARNGTVQVEAYWRPFEAPAPRFKHDHEYAEAFLEIFDKAVSARLRTTGGIGSQLSSGLDSSSVTASAAMQLARQGRRMTSFTAVPRGDFTGTGWHGRLPDEGPGAADVARMYPNVDHVLLPSGGQDMIPLITRVTDALDEPVPNVVNALWDNAILQAASDRGITTLLVGLRGNLTFSHAGLEALGKFLREGRWLRLARTAHSFRQKGLVSFRASATWAFAGLLPDSLYRRLSRTEDFDLTYSPANSELIDRLGLRQKMLDQFFSNQHDLRADRLDLFHTYDVDMYNLAYQILYGVDVRDPSADRRVLDFCFSLPPEQYVAGGVPRSLVRRAMKDRLPAATLTRTRRGQQGADWALVVADALPQLRQQIALNDSSPSARRLLDLPRMNTLLDTWPSSNLDQQNVSLAWGDALCRGFSYGYFLRSHEQPQTTSADAENNG